MKSPAFQFYADDFIAGTSDMSNEEVGAYTRLLCGQWGKGGLPNDPDRLSRMAGGMAQPSLGHVLSKFRLCDNGFIRNDCLESERQKQAVYRESQSQKGKQGAIRRWENGTGHSTGHTPVDGTGHNPAMPGPMPKHGLPSPLPSPSLLPVPLPKGKGGEEIKPKKARDVTPRKPNITFDALATACGINPQQLTKSEGALLGMALADIMTAMPGAVDEFAAREIEDRAENYGINMPPGCRLTPPALAKHWSSCAKAIRRDKNGVVKGPTWGIAI